MTRRKITPTTIPNGMARLISDQVEKGSERPRKQCEVFVIARQILHKTKINTFAETLCNDYYHEFIRVLSVKM